MKNYFKEDGVRQSENRRLRRHVKLEVKNDVKLDWKDAWIDWKVVENIFCDIKSKIFTFGIQTA